MGILNTSWEFYGIYFHCFLIFFFLVKAANTHLTSDKNKDTATRLFSFSTSGRWFEVSFQVSPWLCHIWEIGTVLGDNNTQNCSPCPHHTPRCHHRSALGHHEGCERYETVNIGKITRCLSHRISNRPTSEPLRKKRFGQVREFRESCCWWRSLWSPRAVPWQRWGIVISPLRCVRIKKEKEKKVF